MMILWDGGAETGIFVAFIHLIVSGLVRAWPLSCPHLCFCNTPNMIVYCSRRNLPMIPARIPDKSRQLMLTSNLFQSNLLRRSNLSSFVDLEHLYLSECGIEYIEADTFIDLRKLEWLDLSNNRIQILPDFTFRGLSLMHLFLNGNRKIRLRTNSFANLATNGLYLNDCSLKDISVDMIKPLNSSVKKLWLNGNDIEKLHKSFLSIFETLNHVRLGGNPLHCNCELVWLKGLYDRKPGVFTGASPPSCFTPKAMKTKYFNNLVLTDFRCQPPVFSNIDASINNDNTGRLRCTANGDPVPVLYWIKPRGQMIRFTPPPDGVVSYNEGILRISETANDRSGQYKCLASNPGGNITLTINVTWSKLTPPLSTDADLGEMMYPHNRPQGEGDPHSVGVQTVSPPDVRNNYEPPYNHSQPHVTVDKALSNDKDSPFSSRDRTQYRDGNYDDRRPWGWGHGPLHLFSLTELIGSVIGTFVATLLMCLLCMSVYHRYKWSSRYPREHYYDRTYERAYDRAYDRESKLYASTDTEERMYISRTPDHEHIYESPKR